MKFWAKLFILVVVADQLSKFLAGEMGWAALNSGVSFGLGSSWPVWLWLFLHGLCLVILFWWTKSSVGNKQNWLILILAAGFSNWLDRLFLGGVRDWLIVPLWGGRNNLADWLVIVGCIGWWWSGVKLDFRNDDQNN